jgi:hypothetical protein
VFSSEKLFLRLQITSTYNHSRQLNKEVSNHFLSVSKFTVQKLEVHFKEALVLREQIKLVASNQKY